MRTTVDLDADLLARAMQVARARTRTELLELGLQSLLDIEARRVAIGLGGSMPDLELPPRRGGAPDLDASLPITRRPKP